MAEDYRQSKQTVLFKIVRVEKTQCLKVNLNSSSWNYF